MVQPAGWQARRDWGEGEGFTTWKPVDHGDLPLWMARVIRDPERYEVRPVFAEPFTAEDLMEAMVKQRVFWRNENE